ncbi:hypothetical protein HZS_6015 [Henneguya salminicola]|nr:hypothetical protein HZS_6015 [Henneguya salminicola]
MRKVRSQWLKLNRRNFGKTDITLTILYILQYFIQTIIFMTFSKINSAIIYNPKDESFVSYKIFAMYYYSVGGIHIA